MEDKIRGLLVGGALGDALGAPHESRYNRTTKYTGRLEHHVELYNRFSKTSKIFDVGQLTDDSEMARCITVSIINPDNGQLEYLGDRALQEYLKWANHTLAIGVNTSKLFKGIKTVKGYRVRYAKIFQGPTSRFNAQSNGALMRCGPLALFGLTGGLDKLKQVVHEDCFLTNPSPVAEQCSLLLTTAIFFSFSSSDKQDIFQRTILSIPDAKLTDPVRHMLKAVSEKSLIDVDNRQRGWCFYGLYMAFYAFMWFDDYASGINHIISQFGDTDTNACIAGYLLGSFYGYAGLNGDPTTSDNIQVLFDCKPATRPPEFWMANYCSDETVLRLMGALTII